MIFNFCTPARLRMAVNTIRKFLLIFASLLLIQIKPVSAQSTKDVEILVECVEYAGNDKFYANFGYNNPNKSEVSVNPDNSVVISNNGKSKSNGVNTFKPGRQSNVFRAEFTSQDRVLWHLVLPNGVVKEVTASINSNHCNSSGSNIIPYYQPPKNGKLDNSVIGPELTSLYNSYIATGTATSNFIFQIDGSKVLIEVKSKPTFYSFVLNLLTTSFGFSQVTGDAVNNVMTGWIPINKLLNINNYAANIEYARPVYPSVLNNSGRALNSG